MPQVNQTIKAVPSGRGPDRNPTSNTNQYTQRVISGFTSPHTTPKNDPAYLALKSLLDKSIISLHVRVKFFIISKYSTSQATAMHGLICDFSQCSVFYTMATVINSNIFTPVNNHLQPHGSHSQYHSPNQTPCIRIYRFIRLIITNSC